MGENATEPKLVSALLAEHGAILLDGTSEALHVLSTLALSLQTTKAQEAYLRLFCAFVRREDGPFQILYGVRDIPFLHAVDRAAFDLDVRPPSIRDGPGEGSPMVIRAHVLHGNALFDVEFAVYENGWIDMLRSEKLKSDLSISRRRFDGVFRSPLED